MREGEAAARGRHEAVRCLVVSLARQPARRALMRAQMAQAGVEGEFVDAVDLRATPREALLQRCAARGPWGRLRLHDMACTASHLKALETFLAGTEPYALILEDDVFISPEAGAWLGDMGWWPEGVDLVKVERWRNPRQRIVMGRSVATHLGRELRPLCSRHVGAAGYLLTRRAAERVLAHRPADFPIDHLLFNINASPLARSLTILQLHPALLTQGNEPPPDPAPAPPASVASERETGLAYWLREARRGVFEINRLPQQAAALLGGGLLVKPSWK